MDAGEYHNCGVKPDGSVACWGYNAFGQSNAPSGIFSQVSASVFHTCGVKPDGSIACWGDNGYGQTIAPSGTFTQVSTGRLHTCGLKPDGSVACWGLNSEGQTDAPSGTFSQISAGVYHTCGLKQDGSVACWGYNGQGQSDALSVPVLTTQPTDQNTTVGGSFTLSVTATGTNPLTYQWRKDGTPVQGATTSTYTVNPATADHAGTYDVVVTNAAGRATSEAATVVVAPADSTGPVITPTVTGTLGDNGWYTSNVGVSWSVTDDESDISNQDGCGSSTLSTDTTGTTLTCEATSAGGTSSESVTIKRDATKPTLAPSISATEVLLNGSATATPNASDATSGVASENCATVLTNSVGNKSVSCTATDNAGNESSTSLSYKVTYAFSGFSQPVDNNVANKAKAGQAIPLKWRLTDANGAPVSSLSSVQLSVASLSCSFGTTPDAVEEYASGSSSLQNLGDGFYQYNWATPKSYAGSCKTLQLDLGEGLYRTAAFQFTR